MAHPFNVKNLVTSIRNYTMFPSLGGPAIPQKPSDVKRNLSNYISPVQLARIRQDIQTWRDCVTEAENAWYPHRVKMQRLFLDTILNGHVFACMDQRMKLTLLKPYNICDSAGNPNDKLTKIIQTKWFKEYMRFALEADAFGYSLIFLGDLVNDSFPKLSEIRRFNVSPDRMNVTQFIYAISGAQFMEDPYVNWHIWVDSPTDTGVSPCGYGYLYKVAFYEILARNVIGFNTDATEMYGMPIRIGKTTKSEGTVERDIFEQALASLGSAGYLLMDPVGDEVDLLESKSLGNGYKIYESLEARCEKKISKIILGHADAMDSVPGKLGQQDDKDSPVNRAKSAIQAVDMDRITDLTNNQLFPKLRNLGFNIPEDHKFVFDNDDELNQVRQDEDKANLVTAQIYQTVKNAGGEPDWDYFSKRTGIKTSKAVVPPPMVNPQFTPKKEPSDNQPDDKKNIVDQKIKSRIEQLYGTSGRIFSHVNGNGHAH